MMYLGGHRGWRRDTGVLSPQLEPPVNLRSKMA